MTIIGFTAWFLAAINAFTDHWRPAFFWLGSAIFIMLLGKEL
jgi:hypothetical protein